MPRRVPLPPALTAQPFGHAAAAASGIGAERLRSPDIRHPHAGVYTTSVAPTDLVSRCREYLPVLLPGLRFSHSTAALLWGCPLASNEGPLHVTATLPSRAPRRPNVIGHHTVAGQTHLRYGLPVSAAAAAWLELASLAPVDELVIAADHLTLDPFVLDPYDIRPYATVEQLRRALGDFHGRGARRAASALGLVRPGAESRTETLLRLLLSRAGLPEPTVNGSVRDARGRELGRGDLVYDEWRVVVEYDGDHHRTSRRQYERDISRFDSFVETGYTVVRVRSRGLFTAPDDTVARVTRALLRAGWRP